MLHFSRWKTIGTLLVCLVGVLYALPTFFSKEQLKALPSWVPWAQVKLGLDLRGGAHMLYTVDINELKLDFLENIRDDARKRLRDANSQRSANISFTGINIVGDTVQVRFETAGDAEKGVRELRGMIQQVGGGLVGTGGGDDLAVALIGTAVNIQPTPLAINDRITRGIEASIETVRRRIDPDGTTEASIVRQGADRILIQVPGVETTDELKARVGQTAKLSFKLVHATMTAEEARQTRIPAGWEIVRVDPKEQRSGGPSEYLLERRAIVTGEDLADAGHGKDQRTQEDVVTFRFNQAGARRFGRVTSENVGRPFAIQLDDKVISAPVIREPILGGTGQISGNFSLDDAIRLGILLRSGALPAKLTIVEERVVGASLGADSIKAGVAATLIGALLVVIFMVFAYGLFGVFAIIAVAINVAMILAMMTFWGSTLTLPGIAGILLTLGMAVDANVLIYERIREELRNGKTTLSAIEAGFDRAFATILDANLTTLIAGIVMFWLGSGPVRGFAVTLSLGIFTTVFTAYTVSRLLVSWWVRAQKTRKLPAPL